MRLVLASASPRRAELLRTAGFAFDTVVVDLDERVRDGEAPAAYVRRLAMEKSARALARAPELKLGPTTSGPTTLGPTTLGASNVAQRALAPDLKVGPTTVGAATDVGPSFSSGGNDIVILGADTAVVVDGEILGKPRDDDDACAMLSQLSGRAHEVLTGISLRCTSGEIGGVETTMVWFSRLSEADIAWYVASGEGRDKAGAYAIQGLASRFVPRIDGSYANVVGLPVARVVELLREIGLLRACP